MSFQVTVKGFKSKHDAQVFCDWYSGQGEQDADYWFDVHGDRSNYHFESMKENEDGYEMDLE